MPFLTFHGHLPTHLVTCHIKGGFSPQCGESRKPIRGSGSHLVLQKGQLRPVCGCKSPRLSRTPRGRGATNTDPSPSPNGTPSSPASLPSPSQPSASLPPRLRGAWFEPQPTPSSPTRPCAQRSDRSGARGRYCPRYWGSCSPSPEWPGKDSPPPKPGHRGESGGSLLHPTTHTQEKGSWPPALWGQVWTQLLSAGREEGARGGMSISVSETRRQRQREVERERDREKEKE